MSKSDSQAFGRARDELFSHINRCGVLQASADQQVAWMEDTMEYMSERFPDLLPEELGELRMIGIRFCQPVIGHGPASSGAYERAEEAGDEAADAESAAA